MFPKFICVFTLLCSQDWHRDWGRKNKWEPRASLIMHKPSVQCPQVEQQGGFGTSPNPGSVLGWVCKILLQWGIY
jgi:hypothetical protein